MIRDSARAYAQDKLMARVPDVYATETTEPEIFTKMGLLGTTTPRQLSRSRRWFRDLWSCGRRGGGCGQRIPVEDVGARAYREIIADGSSDVTRQRPRIFRRVEGHSRD